MIKFPNYINDLRKLRRALRVASMLTSAQLADDEFYGYELLHADVIRTKVPEAELRQRPRQNQGPITQGRGLPQMFILLGMMERVYDGLALTDTGTDIAAQEGATVTDEERRLWQEAVLGLRFPHQAYPDISPADVNMRPAHVMLSMLASSPLPSQGLAVAFAAVSESSGEIERLRQLALRWGVDDEATLAAEAGTTRSELKNNAKVFPGLLEQCRLIRRKSGQAHIEPRGLEVLNIDSTQRTPRRQRARPILPGQPRAWVPTAVNPDDAVERALLRATRLEKASLRHQETLQEISRMLRAKRFDTTEADYDILAKRDDLWLLIEVKTLSDRNARRQTISALGQLAFYYQEIKEEASAGTTIYRVVAFDRAMPDQRIRAVLTQEGVRTMWNENADWIIDDPELEALIDA